MATQHTYRVIVRGRWDGLTDGARAKLLAEADQHGLAQHRFTPEGSLVYDATLRSFTYRYVIVSDAADGEELAAALAEEKAEAVLTAAGYGYRDLRSSATDMDTMKINRKGR
ncbi:GYD domain-containing protein OS=Streptomyces rimosus subsp. rimosus (strain ATCC / DSM 40260/ JCM 4667 / NRRL 2234) OX=1265868 GN=SRIM_033575 PE=4 SV=1 [Streptomyces rimosus subsp. rimosus]